VVNELLRARRAARRRWIGDSRETEPIRAVQLDGSGAEPRGSTREPVTLDYPGREGCVHSPAHAAPSGSSSSLEEVRMGVSWNRSLPEEASSALCNSLRRFPGRWRRMSGELPQSLDKSACLNACSSRCSIKPRERRGKARESS